MEVRDRIIIEATKQFMHCGIRNITMDNIAFNLGISKRTVYENFRDKSDLIYNCMEVLAEKHKKKSNQVLIFSENLIEEFLLFMKEGMRAMNSINPVFFSDLKKYYPEMGSLFYKKNSSQSYDFIKKLLQKGINEKFFRKDIDVVIVAKLFQGQNNLIFNEEIFPRNEFYLPDIFQNMTINFMRGISTKTGIDIIDKIISDGLL